MGHVYTESAVRQENVPNMDDFEIALNLFRTAITETHEDMPHELPAATVFGSCATDRLNICSDIDILILVDDSRITKDEISEKVRSSESFTHAIQWTRESFIHASVYPVILSNLATGGTKNDRQFLSHVVKNSRRGLICGNLDAFLSFFSAAPVQTLARMNAYVGRKAEKLEERLFCYSGLCEEEQARMWLDTYQAPFHAVRRLLDLMDQTDYEDTKAGIFRAFHEIVGDKYAFALLDLKERWAEYVSYVTEAKRSTTGLRCPFDFEDVGRAQLVLDRVLTLGKNTVPPYKR